LVSAITLEAKYLLFYTFFYIVEKH